MKRPFLILALASALALPALPAAAECYADYKAKRDDPLRLHYGVIALPDAACASEADAASAIAQRIAVDGWTLLKVVAIFDAAGLDKKNRRDNAGEFFLRY